MAGMLIQVNYEVALLCVQINDKELFETEYKPFSVLLPRLQIQSLYDFADKYKIKLPKPEVDLYEKKDRDIFLMEAFY